MRRKKCQRRFLQCAGDRKSPGLFPVNQNPEFFQVIDQLHLKGFRWKCDLWNPERESAVRSPYMKQHCVFAKSEFQRPAACAEKRLVLHIVQFESHAETECALRESGRRDHQITAVFENKRPAFFRPAPCRSCVADLSVSGLRTRMHVIGVASEQCVMLPVGWLGDQNIAAFRRETPADSTCRMFRCFHTVNPACGSLPYENRYFFPALLCGMERMTAEDASVHRNGTNAVNGIFSVRERYVKGKFNVLFMQWIWNFREFRDEFQLPGDGVVQCFTENPVPEQCPDRHPDFFAPAVDFKNRVRRGRK